MWLEFDHSFWWFHAANLNIFFKFFRFRSIDLYICDTLKNRNEQRLEHKSEWVEWNMINLLELREGTMYNESHSHFSLSFLCRRTSQLVASDLCRLINWLEFVETNCTPMTKNTIEENKNDTCNHHQQFVHWTHRKRALSDWISTNICKNKGESHLLIENYRVTLAICVCEYMTAAKYVNSIVYILLADH